MAEAIATGGASRRELIAGAAVRPRDLHLDLIRVTAIVMVIALHVSAPLAVRFDSLSVSAWWTANLVESLTRPCVPLFFMVSGLLLLRPASEQPMGQFFARRLTRVLIPFLVWAALYLLWRRYYHGEPMSLTKAALEVLAGPIYGHFWFIYALLGLYLVTPLLQVLTRHADGYRLRWFLALWVVGSSLLPMLEHLTGVHVGIGWTVTLGYVGYFVLGHALRNRRLQGLQWLAAGAGALVLVAVTAAATWWETLMGGELSEVFYDNLSPNVVLLAALMFLMLRSLPLGSMIAGHSGGDGRCSARKHAPEGHAPARRVLPELSGATFGVYLVHPMIQETLHGGWLGFSLSGLSGPPVLAIPATVGAVLGASLLVVRLVASLPGGRFLVG